MLLLLIIAITLLIADQPSHIPHAQPTPAQCIHRIMHKDMDMRGEMVSMSRVFVLEHGMSDSNSESESERQGGKYGRNNSTTTTTAAAMQCNYVTMATTMATTATATVTR
jgi:hypothetical protein